jgi:hypothetical protein
VAGSGIRLWVAGEVVTAALLNAYIQDQVIARFATTAARDAAFGGSGEPTLAEGMFCYIDADDSLYYYSGSSWSKYGITNDSDQLVLSAQVFS